MLTSNVMHLSYNYVNCINDPRNVTCKKDTQTMVIGDHQVFAGQPRALSGC
jgi:hypothetical protein